MGGFEENKTICSQCRDVRCCVTQVVPTSRVTPLRMRVRTASFPTEQPWTDRAVLGKTSKDKGQASLRDSSRAPAQFQSGTLQPAVAKRVGEFTLSRIKLFGVKGAPCLCLCWNRESRRAARRLMTNIANYQTLINI